MRFQVGCMRHHVPLQGTPSAKLIQDGRIKVWEVSTDQMFCPESAKEEDVANAGGACERSWRVGEV
jgi:hypothetical protein